MSAVSGHGIPGSGAVLLPAGLAKHPPTAARGWVGAWSLVVAIGALTAGLYVRFVVPAPPLETDTVFWWPLVAGLMWAAEIAAVRVGVGGRLVRVPLVVVPTVIGFYHVAPAALVLARLVASGLALVIRNQRSPLRVAIVLVGVAASTSVGVLALDAVVREAPAGFEGVLATSYVGAAAMIATGTLIDALFAAVTRSGVAVGGVLTNLAVGLATAFVCTSLAVVAIVFLDGQPGDLWALAAPTVVGLLGYRAFSLQRGREARLSFVYDCSQILQSPELDEATLGRVVARAQAMFHTAVVEVTLSPGPRPGMLWQTVVDARGVARTDAMNEDEARLRSALLGPLGSGRHLGRDQLGPAGLLDDRVGMIVAVRGSAGIIGTMLVVDRLDHLGPFGTEDLRVLEALASRLGLVAENAGLAGQLAASVGDVRKLAAIVQSSEDAITAIDTAGRITAWNPAATRLFGYAPEEMIGQIASDVIPDSERAQVRESFSAALAGAPVSNVRMDWRRRDGHTVPVSITLSPVHGEGGEVVGASAIVRDESDRLRAEAAVAASAEQLRDVIDGSPLGMGTAGTDLRWTQANPALCALLGLPAPETIGRPVTEMVHPDDRGTVGILEELLFDGRPGVRSVERRYVSRGGSVVWTHVTARALRDSQSGAPLALYTIQDITERRGAEERTRITEERFRRAALAISAIQDPSRVIGALLESARDTLRAEYAAVLTYSEDGSALPGLETSGVEPDALVPQLDRLLTGSGPGGDVHADALAEARRLGRPLRLRDLQANVPAAGPAFTGPTLSSLLAVPLAQDPGGRVALYLFNKLEAAEFSAGDEAIGVALATHAAVCLENARVNAHARELVLELDRANAELLTANDAKTRFLATVAHELRTPLHAIVVAADLVNDPPLGPLTAQQTRDFSLTIESSGRHMVRLVDDLGDLARIEAGRLEIRPVSVALADILTEVEASLAAAARARGIELDLSGGRDAAVVADPVRLRQILTNLVGNAIKFTERKGRVWVAVRLTRSSHRITVHDTGIGIGREDLERAFLPFEQVSRTSTPGAGLGLAISRSLAELHGGTLEASSVPGRGSAFTLTLPRRRQAPARRPVPIVIDRSAGRSEGGDRPILVVEDDQTALALATSVLHMAGYEVWPTTGFAEARDRLDRGTPALILLDLRLGDGDGVDLIRLARSRPSTATVPILVISADTTPEDVRRAREAGCNDFVPKPIRPRALLTRIDDLTQAAEETAARV